MPPPSGCCRGTGGDSCRRIHAQAMEEMLKRIPVKVGNIPWRNNNLSTLHVDPPLSEQGETVIGIYLLALGRSAIFFGMEEGSACGSVHCNGPFDWCVLRVQGGCPGSATLW